MHIRPYEPRDRAAVRQLAADTADAGRPIEQLFPDRDIFADLVTRYHTDFEPESSWVADEGGRVVAYLTGCLRPARFRARMLTRILPVVIFKSLVRGVFLRPQVARNFALWIRPRPVQNVHLHLNVAAAARARGIGGGLLETFLARARTAGAREVSAMVREDNTPGRRFFERHGFVAGAVFPAFTSRAGVLRSILYVRREPAAAAPRPR